MISKLIALSTLLLPVTVFATVDSFTGIPVLVQELAPDGSIKNQYLDSFQRDQGSSFISQSPDAGSFSVFGICLQSDGSSCVSNINSRSEFNRSFSTSNGRRQVDPAMVPPVQDFPIAATTTIQAEQAKSLTVKVDQVLMGGLGKTSTTVRILKTPNLSTIPHTFSIPDKDEPNRKPIADVESRLKDLSLGVVQLSSRPDAENLLGQSFGSGTGYFISASGLMMTNHHVISEFKPCMENLVCQIDFKQVIADGSRRRFTAKATLLVISEDYDFALLKIDVPANMNFSFFKIENQKVGPDLVTLGYPGDFKDGDDTRLTYSQGKLVGFHSRVYATSDYIFQGASGSPLLNADDLNLVAILSNGAGNPIPEIGSPGLARPILTIDAEFGLSDYISGVKITRVRDALQKLQSAASLAQANVALDGYLREKTFMGLTSLKRLMLTHNNVEVRIAILKALEKMKVIVGSSDIEDGLLQSNPQINPKIVLPIKH